MSEVRVHTIGDFSLGFAGLFAFNSSRGNDALFFNKC